MRRSDALNAYDLWEREEFKALCSFAYSNFNGGTKIDDVDAHFEAGLDHLVALRAKVTESITRKLKD